LEREQLACIENKKKTKMWWEWWAGVFGTALRGWCYVALVEVSALVVANCMEYWRGYSERIHAIVAVPLSLLLIVTPWSEDVGVLLYIDMKSLAVDACHVMCASTLLWTVWRLCDDVLYRYFATYRRGRMVYDATRRLQYPRVDVLPAERPHGYFAHAVVALYYSLAAPRAPSRQRALVGCLTSFLELERALRFTIQTLAPRLERTVVRRWMCNYKLYRDYGLFVNSQMCRGRWSPFWDTLQGRNPFASRVPIIGSCPIPFVDFFFVDYSPEQVLIVHARLQHQPHQNPLQSPNGMSPHAFQSPNGMSLHARSELWTQALWKAMRCPQHALLVDVGLTQRPELLQPLALFSNTPSPRRLWRHLYGLIRRHLHKPRPQIACDTSLTRVLQTEVGDTSLFRVLPTEIAAHVYGHFDFLDHMHLRSCSRYMHRLSQLSKASCRRMQIDFGACDHTTGPLPFLTRTHVQPHQLRIKNVGAYISSLAFLSAPTGNIIRTLQELHLENVARGRCSFAWLSRLTCLQALRVSYLPCLTGISTDADALDATPRLLAWRPVVASTHLALRHLDVGADIFMLPEMQSSSVLTRSLVHLIISYISLTTPFDTTQSSMGAAVVRAPDFTHFSSLTSLIVRVSEEDGPLLALRTFPALSRLEIRGYNLNVENIRHLHDAFCGMVLQHMVFTDARECVQSKPYTHLFECVAKNAPQLRTLAIATNPSVVRCCFTHKMALLRSCRFLERLELDERSSAISYEGGKAKKRLHKSLGEGLPPSMRVLALTSRHVWAYGNAGLSCFASNTALEEIHLFCRPRSDDPALLDEERAHILFRTLNVIAERRNEFYTQLPIRTMTTFSTIKDRLSFRYFKP
jgi:hypothetical protein